MQGSKRTPKIRCYVNVFTGTYHAVVAEGTRVKLDEYEGKRFYGVF
jgi:hypothetical protein